MHSQSNSKTVAKILVKKWFHVYGVPNRIHSDQGRCFDSNIIKALCKMYSVEQSFTSPYNPRGNAFCECFNRTLFGLLKTLKFPCVCHHHNRNSNLRIISITCINQTIPLPSWLKIDQSVQLQNPLRNI